MTKILVCGGRDFWNSSLLDRTLDRFLDPTQENCIVHGDARGADWLAKAYTSYYDNTCQKPYPADWKKHGRSAGTIRNQLMLDSNPDIEMVVAFPGGIGTADMVRRARKEGFYVLEVQEDD